MSRRRRVFISFSAPRRHIICSEGHSRTPKHERRGHPQPPSFLSARQRSPYTATRRRRKPAARPWRRPRAGIRPPPLHDAGRRRQAGRQPRQRPARACAELYGRPRSRRCYGRCSAARRTTRWETTWRETTWRENDAAQSYSSDPWPPSAGTSCSTSGEPMMRSYMARTSVMAVSKCEVGSKDCEMKTWSALPSCAGVSRS